MAERDAIPEASEEESEDGDFDAEDNAIMTENPLNRWSQPQYTLRLDEVQLFIDIFNWSHQAMRSGILFYASSADSTLPADCAGQKYDLSTVSVVTCYCSQTARCS